MKIVYWLVVVSCGIVASNGVPPSRVRTVDGGNFYAMLREHPRLMLFFYAPWCGHSKKMEPEFEKAAMILYGNVGFGRIDGSLEVEIAEEFGLKSFPGIFLLHRGHWEEFTGRRQAQAMVDWLRGKVGPALEVKKTESDLQGALASRGPGAIVLARGSDKLRDAMTRVAERNRSLGSYLFIGGSGPDEVVLHRGLGETVRMEVDVDNREFESALPRELRSALLPSFGEVAEENFFHYETRGLDALLWALFANSTDEPTDVGCSRVVCLAKALEHADTFRAVSEAFKNIKAVFVDVATYKDYVTNELGVDEFPALLLQKGSLSTLDEESPGPRYMIPFTSELNAQSITAWVTQVMAETPTTSRTLGRQDL